MKYSICVTLIFLLFACSVEPEPLRFGEDSCHHCKMTLMDKKFGAELVSKKGKAYKFDDVNCMLAFYNSNEIPVDDFSYKLVVDFSRPSELINAADAFYLKSAAIKSPMASEIAAFAKKESMEAAKEQLNGIYLVWGELVTQFKE